MLRPAIREPESPHERPADARTMNEEVLLILMVLVFVGAIVLIGPILAIVALVRASRVKVLERDLRELTAEVRRLRERGDQGVVVAQVAGVPDPQALVPGSAVIPPTSFPATAQTAEAIDAAVVEAEIVQQPFGASAPASATRGDRRLPDHAATVDGRTLELFIGRKALGWVAVVVLLFGTVFFLRYAYENQWIGPIGRVSIGLMAAVGLIAAGRKYHRQSWHTFSRMLTAAGVLTLYVSTYSAFGFYQLVPQQAAGILLFVVVAESAMLAIVYDSWAIALMALVGGFLIPVLMQSDRDQYQSLFTYLAILNIGSLSLLARRAWHAIGAIALVGTQLLFWMWYDGNYHPEKLEWAVGFQSLVYLLHWGHGLASAAWRRPSTTVEEIVRSSLNATAVFAAFYVLLDEHHHAWLGAVAVGLAAIESFGAWILLRRPETPPVRLLTSVAISLGLIALAFPLQARSHWVAVGWAAQAAALSWFGLRINAVALRVMALVLTALAGLRILIVNAPWLGRDDFSLLWNDFATPSLLVVLLLGGSLFLSRQRLASAGIAARMAAGAIVVACVTLTLFVLSLDVYQYLRSLEHRSELALDWRRVAQMSVSAVWTLFASALLAAGFMARLGVLRWSSLAIFALTVLKVFMVDMAGLDQIYRIVAFLLLAVVLGAATWAYNRLTVPDDRVGK